MNDVEAKRILAEVTSEVRREAYGALVAQYLRDSEHRTVAGESGANYQVEVQALWDGPELGHLRVMISIDDGGWRAVKPLSTDFIVAPDGSFVGE